MPHAALSISGGRNNHAKTGSPFWRASNWEGLAPIDWTVREVDVVSFNNRTAEATPIECIVCGGALRFFPDLYPLVFHCDGGHSQTLWDILDELLLHRKQPSASTVDYWKQKTVLLRSLAGKALRRGAILTAADLQEAASRVAQWVEKLEQLRAGA